MTVLSQPTPVNMLHLLSREVGQQAPKTQETQQLSQAIKETLHTFSALISEQLGPEDRFLVATNKGMDTSYYVLHLHPKSLRLIEQNGFQKMTTILSLSELTVTLNDRKVDRSFIYSLLNKMDKITADIRARKARFFGETKP